MAAPAPPAKGRGATFNPANRFRQEEREAVDDGWTESIDAEDADTELRPLKTVVRVTPARTGLIRLPMPSIHTLVESPRLRNSLRAAPTPAGVPVSTISPGCSVMREER